jgi:soluble lytic murein transglycosylase-like protein
MQVNVKVWPYSKQEMLDPDRNLQAGSKILANYIRESGNVRDGLRHYYGILPDSTASDEYADKVLSMTRRR